MINNKDKNTHPVNESKETTTIQDEAKELDMNMEEEQINQEEIEMERDQEDKLEGHKGLTYKSRNAITGLLFVSPWIIGFLIFVAYPLFRTVFFSFKNVLWSAETGYTYEHVGFDNYKRILTENIEFSVAAQDFAVEVLIYVPVIIALSIIIAMLLNTKLKGTTLFRLIFFLPIIILNGELMENMNDYGGLSLDVNGLIIGIVHKIAPESMVDIIIFLFDTVLEILWYCGLPILIFLAALQKIDKSLYEAAQIDGASGWNIFWKITLPTIYPLISVTIVYIVVFLANFDANPINDIIREARFDASKREGYASAQALLYALIQTILIVFLYLLTKRREKGGART
ncbi:carbohydrate ABC transporter permease [Haloplasma contractile]|uniref:ABC transporter membrane-spanning permease-multiple sugar protein n=1 Tax=Haloplasma contractile SSD-17B TaxID=1033810 RepID=U2EEE1_9MOLU|nr:sugar ABC transporter permease [Haloplasma contractile]ERJ13061.1 ABC transporter membrane-spanning permease-multiple sugar protein [Haloplasma contractile SSD-17B]